MMVKRGAALVLAVLIMLTGPVGSNVSLGEIKNSTVYLNTVYEKTFALNRELAFKGVMNGDRMYFTVDSYWKAEGGEIVLYITQSALLDRGLSTITLSVNGSPIHSARLDYPEAQPGVLKVQTPGDYLKEGINELKTETYTRISDKPCADDVNEGNWVKVHKESYVSLQFREEKPGGLISQYPYPFVRAADEWGTGDTVLLLNENPDKEELAAALQLSAGLGKLSGSRDLDLNLSFYSAEEEGRLTGKNILYVGKENQAPEAILKAMPQDSATNMTQGAILFTAPSPYDRNTLLLGVVAKGEGEALDKAVRLLQNEDLLSQIKDETCLVLPDAKVDILEELPEATLTLEELGYTGGITLTGPYHQQAVVGISLPKNRKPQSGARLELYFRYAGNLNFERSLVTAYLSGTPIGSKRLEAAHQNGDVLTLDIPADVPSGSYLELTLAFELELIGDECTFRREDMPWAYVEPSSFIHVPTRTENDLLFENYPWPLIREGRFNAVSVVLPKKTSDMNLELLANVFAFMGRSLVFNDGDLKVVWDEEFKDGDKNANFVLAGTPSQLESLKILNDTLFFKYDSDFTRFISNEKRLLTESYAQTLASLQLLASPYSTGRGIFILTAPRLQSLSLLKNYLTQGDKNYNLLGNATLAEPGGTLANHYFIKKGSTGGIAENVPEDNQTALIFIITLGTLLLFLILALILYRRRRKVR